MTANIVHSKDTAKHRYNIIQDEATEDYFLTVDDKPYKENHQLFKGSFDDLLKKIDQLVENESLKTFS